MASLGSYKEKKKKNENLLRVFLKKQDNEPSIREVKTKKG